MPGPHRRHEAGRADVSRETERPLEVAEAQKQGNRRAQGRKYEKGGGDDVVQVQRLSRERIRRPAAPRQPGKAGHGLGRARAVPRGKRERARVARSSKAQDTRQRREAESRSAADSGEPRQGQGLGDQRLEEPAQQRVHRAR